MRDTQITKFNKKNSVHQNTHTKLQQVNIQLHPHKVRTVGSHRNAVKQTKNTLLLSRIPKVWSRKGRGKNNKKQEIILKDNTHEDLLFPFQLSLAMAF